MDIIMDERTEGFFTVQQLRRDPELEEVPIFVVTALYSAVPDFGVEADPGWMAHDEFLSKPVDPDLLLQRINARLADDVEAASRHPGGTS